MSNVISTIASNWNRRGSVYGWSMQRGGPLQREPLNPTPERTTRYRKQKGRAESELARQGDYKGAIFQAKRRDPGRPNELHGKSCLCLQCSRRTSLPQIQQHLGFIWGGIMACLAQAPSSRSLWQEIFRNAEPAQGGGAVAEDLHDRREARKFDVGLKHSRHAVGKFGGRNYGSS